MSRDKFNDLYFQLESQRLALARLLFSPQSTNYVRNAKHCAQAAAILVEIAAKLEYEGRQ